MCGMLSVIKLVLVLRVLIFSASHNLLCLRRCWSHPSWLCSHSRRILGLINIPARWFSMRLCLCVYSHPVDILDLLDGLLTLDCVKRLTASAALNIDWLHNVAASFQPASRSFICHLQLVDPPSNSIWPYLSSDLVRSEREYC